MIGVLIVLAILITFLRESKKPPANSDVGHKIIMTRFNDLEQAIRNDSIARSKYLESRQAMIDSLPKQTVIQKIIYRLQHENNLTYSAADSVLYRKWANGLIEEANRENSGYYDSIFDARSRSAANKNSESLKIIR